MSMFLPTGQPCDIRALVVAGAAGRWMEENEEMGWAVKFLWKVRWKVDLFSILYNLQVGFFFSCLGGFRRCGLAEGTMTSRVSFGINLDLNLCCNQDVLSFVIFLPLPQPPEHLGLQTYSTRSGASVSLTLNPLDCLPSNSFETSQMWSLVTFTFEIL